MSNYYHFTLKLLLQSDLHSNLQVLYEIKIIFFFNFADNLKKDLVLQQIGENTIFSRQ